MPVELFKCSFCGKNKRMEFLAQVLDESGALGNVQEQISYIENLRTEAYNNYLKETDGERRMELLEDIKSYDDALKKKYERVKNSKKPACSSCLVKSREKAKVSTFTCRLCGEEKEGKGTGLHIDDWQDEGISPADWHIFCKSCIQEHALAPPPNFHCPRNSYGRDDYNLERQRFDCSCQIKGITY